MLSAEFKINIGGDNVSSGVAIANHENKNCECTTTIVTDRATKYGVSVRPTDVFYLKLL